MMIGGGIRGPRAPRGKRLSDRGGGGGSGGHFSDGPSALPVQPVSLKNVVLCHTARITSFHMIKDSAGPSQAKSSEQTAQGNSSLPIGSSESNMKIDKQPADVPKLQNKSFLSKRLTRIIIYILAQCVPCYRQKILQYSFRDGETKELQFFKPFTTYNEVTSTCLWHACRAISVGVILILAGITMATLGYLSDLKDLEKGEDKGGESFKLNNLSFAGPVIMGFGGFLIVAACVMTFETRDNAAKIGPTATDKSNGMPQNIPQVVQFKSSSSQTTFLDRNIVQSLNTPSINVGSPSSSLTRHSKVSPLPSSPLNTSSSMERHGTEGNSASVSLAVKRSRFRGSNSHSGSGSTTKRASISGQLPLEDPSTMEPGLAIMDEMGRQALTSTFLKFQRSTAQKLATYFQSDEIVLDPLCVPNSLPKCPSAPHIPQEPIQDHQMSSSNDRALSSDNPNGSNPDGSSSKAGKFYQYKVLTPTMYRSCMAATRQAVSMDCEGSNELPHKLHREENSLRVQSPLIKRQVSPNESMDMELGASANSTFPKHHHHHPRSLPPKHYSADDEESGSMTLDLHVEGSRPVTLVVKDESKCSGSHGAEPMSRTGSTSKKDWSKRSRKSLEELAIDLDFIDEDSSSLPEEEESHFTCSSVEVDARSFNNPSYSNAKITLNLASPEDITDDDEIMLTGGGAPSRKFSQRHFLRRQNKIDAPHSPRL